jgi:hypothetical protein
MAKSKGTSNMVDETDGTQTDKPKAREKTHLRGTFVTEKMNINGITENKRREVVTVVSPDSEHGYRYAYRDELEDNSDWEEHTGDLHEDDQPGPAGHASAEAEAAHPVGTPAKQVIVQEAQPELKGSWG